MKPIVVGIDIGGTKTLIGLVDSCGKIVEKEQFVTDIAMSPEEHLRKCMDSVQTFLLKYEKLGYSILGIGVNVPGLANPKEGILVHAPYLGWRNVKVQEIMELTFPKCLIKIANDVNSCALGERLFGKGKDFDNFLWVTISTGIGGGLIINQEIYEGEHFIAGEIGHLVVEWENGKKCGCGNDGCVEAHGSGTAIARMAGQLITEGSMELANFFKKHDLDITAKNVAYAASNGVQEAIEIMDKAGEYIGRAFSYAANILNPGAIIVGGGVGLAFDLLEPSIRKTFETSVINPVNKKLPIIRTGLGYEAALIGAASLIYTENL